MNSPDVDDSFARLNYHQDSEVGVNEQIKCVTAPYHLPLSQAALRDVGCPFYSSMDRLFCLQQSQGFQSRRNFLLLRTFEPANDQECVIDEAGLLWLAVMSTQCPISTMRCPTTSTATMWA